MNADMRPNLTPEASAESHHHLSSDRSIKEPWPRDRRNFADHLSNSACTRDMCGRASRIRARSGDGEGTAHEAPKRYVRARRLPIARLCAPRPGDTLLRRLAANAFTCFFSYEHGDPAYLCTQATALVSPYYLIKSNEHEVAWNDPGLIGRVRIQDKVLSYVDP